MTEPEIKNLPEKSLAGICLEMSFMENKTQELWQNFMPRKHQIPNIIGSGLYSAEVYDSQFFKAFDPSKKFEKWAAVEVADLQNLPENMQSLMFPAGLYAVFIHKGPASKAPETYQHIYTTWVPTSDYELDERPHFAVMGANYDRNSPESEEEILIPIKKKAPH